MQCNFSSDSHSVTSETKYDTFSAEIAESNDKSGAESKTWTLNPLIINGANGQTLLTIANIRFTIVKAPNTGGGYRCYMTLDSEWTTGWGRTHYSDNTALNIFMLIQNSSSGLLLRWDIGRIHNECGWVNKTMSFRFDFDPDIYDIIQKQLLTVEGANFYQC